MASASASQSTPSSSPVPTVSQSSSSRPGVAAPGPAPTSSTPRPSSASSSTPAVPTPAPVPSTRSSSTTTSTSSTHSSSTGTSNAAPAQTTVFVAPSESRGSSSVNVVAPIAAVAGILIIIYVAYRIYLLHKRRKDEKVPPPPPRMPAIFDRPQSVMYQNAPMMMPGSAPPSYRQSMRPVSMLYNPDSSSSSSLPTKGAQTSASGHSTPTQPGFPVADETGRQSPLPYHLQERSFRGGMPPRPHSVASFGSNRYSSYGTPRTPYMNRVEVVLPQPLAPEASALSSASARQSRFSTYNGPSNPDMRPQSMILPPLAITPEGDWTHRVTTTAEERASSSIDHSAPPLPPKDRPKSAILLSGTSSVATSRDHAMPGGYPSSPAAHARSVSPPEPLLAAGVFASSSSDSTSRPHSLDMASDEAAKAAKPKV